MKRRAQKPITIRSDRAAARLALLTGAGRSQAHVIEEALDRMPVPQPLDDIAVRRAAIEAILARIPPGSFMSMKEFDALEYDEYGDPR